MAAPRARRGLPNRTFVAGPEASLGQSGQRMVQVTSPNKALRLTASLLGAASLACSCPGRKRGKGETQCTSIT